MRAVTWPFFDLFVGCFKNVLSMRIFLGFLAFGFFAISTSKGTMTVRDQ